MRLFYGKADCASCHSGAFQTDHDFHAIAMPQLGPGKGDGFRGREDFGRERVTGDPTDRFRFRTPTLRNVALTGPWGHTGAYATLEAVVPEVSLKAGPDTHVTLPPSIVAQLPEMDLADTMLLEDIAENPGPISRMASQVVLTKELDGMNVAVAPNRPFPSGPAI